MGLAFLNRRPHTQAPTGCWAGICCRTLMADDQASVTWLNLAKIKKKGRGRRNERRGGKTGGEYSPSVQCGRTPGKRSWRGLHAGNESILNNNTHNRSQVWTWHLFKPLHPLANLCDAFVDDFEGSQSNPPQCTIGFDCSPLSSSWNGLTVLKCLEHPRKYKIQICTVYEITHVNKWVVYKLLVR